MRPILFSLGPLEVPAHGAFVLLGLATGLGLVGRYAQREGLDPARMRRLGFTVFLWGAVGCRVLHVALRLPDVIAQPSLGLWLVRQAGIWYGAVLGGLAAGIVVARRHRLDFWRTFDAAAVPVVVGAGVGRLGCFLAGCCWGTPTVVPWAVTYTSPLAHRLHAELPWVPVHPAVLYEFAAALAIGLVLDRIGARPHWPGKIGLLWIVLYGVARFAIEFFRGDAGRGTPLGPLSTSQALALVSVALACAFIWLRARRLATPAIL